MTAAHDRFFPLVVSDHVGPITVEAYLGELDAWERLLGRGEPLVLLRIFRTLDALQPPPSGQQEAARWLSDRRPLLSRLLLGMAVVVPPQALPQMTAMDMSKVFGAPVSSFDDLAEALAWLDGRLVASGQAAVDRDAVLAALA